jgi:hypothetical protein
VVLAVGGVADPVDGLDRPLPPCEAGQGLGGSPAGVQAGGGVDSVHRQEFPPVERPVAPMPELPDPNAVRAWHEKNALRGVGMFDRAGRVAARQSAARAAQAEPRRPLAAGTGRAGLGPAGTRPAVGRLAGNDPDTVLATLAEAFEDNEAPAAAVGIDGAELMLIVLVPDEGTVPEQMPATTQTGNLKLRKLAKANGRYFTCSSSLDTRS